MDLMVPMYMLTWCRSMELEIKSYISTDFESIKNWAPNSSDEVYFQLEIEVGEKNIEDAHVFRLMVATREGVEKKSYWSS